MQAVDFFSNGLLIPIYLECRRKDIRDTTDFPIWSLAGLGNYR